MQKNKHRKIHKMLYAKYTESLNQFSIISKTYQNLIILISYDIFNLFRRYIVTIWNILTTLKDRHSDKAKLFIFWR